MSSAAAVEISFTQRLRNLAEVIEANSLPINDFVSFFRDEVRLTDTDFSKLFAGRDLIGKREGAFIKVESEAYGVMFSALLFRPRENDVEVSVSL